jgi:hypothetical protein
MQQQQHDGDAQASDPVVDLLLWLVTRNGGTHFVDEQGADVVSRTTIRRWLKGDYPKSRVEESVGQIDLWARARFPGEYPPQWARGGLRYYCGPQRRSATPDPEPVAAAPSKGIIDLHAARELTEAPAPNPRDVGLQPAGGRHRWLRGRRVIVSGLAVATIAAAAALGTLALRDHPPGAASVLYARDGAPVSVRSCPDTTCAATTLATGTHVQMICYRDAQRLDLNYSSTRWFDIRDPANDITGWVHSSQVSSQTRVGLC